VQAVAPEAVADDDQEHGERQGRGDDDLARHREGIRNEPDQVGEQHEHEQREHEREEFHPLGAAELRTVLATIRKDSSAIDLQAPREPQRRGARAPIISAETAEHDDHHEQRRLVKAI